MSKNLKEKIKPKLMKKVFIAVDTSSIKEARKIVKLSKKKTLN